MSDSAEELPPVVAALTGDDESFLEMLERDIAALDQFREAMMAAMSGSDPGAAVGSLGVGDAAEGEAARAESAMATMREEAAAAAATMAEASAEAQASTASMADRLAEAEAEQAQFFDSLGAVSHDTFEQMQAESAQAAEAIRQISDATEKAASDLEEVKFELEGTTKSVEQLVATADELQAAMVDSFKQVEAGAITAEQAVENLEAAMTAARTISREQGEAIVAAAPANPGVSLGGLKEAAVTYADAAAAAARYGTVEAQLAASTRLVENADAALADANTRLVQSYLTAANGASSAAETSSAAYAALQRQLGEVADAQSGVAAAMTAEIDALNAVNLAVIRNNTEFENETLALLDLQTAAEATGMATDELALALEQGRYKVLAKAAAEAEATLQSVALADAEERLAAAQMTLVGAMAAVAEGADLDATQIGALRASVASATAEVDSLKAGSEGAGAAMGGMGGSGMMAQMVIFSLASYIPQAISGLQSLTGVGDHTAVSMQGIEESMLGMSTTVSGTGESLATLTEGMGALSNGIGGAVAGLASVDQALTQLQQTDPELAAEQAAKIVAELEATGMSATDAEAALSSYNQAVANTAIQLAAQQHAIEDTVPGTLAYSDAVQQATISLQQQALQAQETADARQSWLSTVLPGTQEWTREVSSATTALEFQGQQAAISADAQRAYLAELVPGTQQYTYALDSASTALLSQASGARISAEAFNSLLPLQAQLGDSAIRDAQAYNQVQQAASEYGNALTALYGIYGNTTAAEASFTGDLANAAGTIKAGKDAVDQWNKAGYQNVQTFTQLSTTAQTVATDIYEQTGSVDQANAALRTMAGQIDTLATKSHLSATQVQQLNEELWGVKNIGDINIPINADTKTAKQELASLMHTIDTSVGEVTVRLLDGGNEYGSIKGPLAARAGGGGVEAGQTYLIGENGPELMTFGGNGFITPNDMISPTSLGGAGGVSASVAPSGGGGPTVVFQFQAGVILGDEIALENAIQQVMGRLGNLVPDQWASIQSTRGR